MSPDQRKQLFNVLCSRSSPNFQKELRSYEAMPQPRSESFEVSCELIDGVRVDQMRVAIMCLYRQEVMDWLVLHHPSIKRVEELLFNNPHEDCFGIGFADYPQEQGVRRVKLYNCYGHQKIQPPMREHIFKLFAMLGLSESEFRKDLQTFDQIRFSCVDWDEKGKAAIKVYYGLFHQDLLFDRFAREFSPEDMGRLRDLSCKALLADKFVVTGKYGNEGKVLRVDMCYNTKDFSSYMKHFDPHGQTAAFFAGFKPIFPELSLQYMGMQFDPSLKIQSYFWLP